MTGRWARFGRGWFVAAFATYAAAFSHVLGEGGTPPAIAIVLAVALSGPLCIALAGRLTRARLAIAVTLSQFLYHGLFSLFGTTTAGPVASPFTEHHHAFVVASGPVDPGRFVAVEPSMVLMHGGAVVATVLVMLYAERIARAVAATVRPVATLVVRAGLRGVVAALAVASSRPRRRRHVAAAWRRRIPIPSLAPSIGFLRHRGPPACAALA